VRFSRPGRSSVNAGHLLRRMAALAVPLELKPHGCGAFLPPPPPPPARGSARGASGAGVAMFRRGGFVARHMAATARGVALRLCKARGKAVCTARGESFAFAPSIDSLSTA